MIPLSEAQDYVITRCRPLEAVTLPLRSAAGMVTTEPVHATGAIPPFANTAVDGFAVIAADLASATDSAAVALDIVGTIAAGDDGDIGLDRGQAIRIMTGAPMPRGADAVAMVEWTEVQDGRVLIDRSLESGDHVRGIGEDLQPGDRVFDAGATLTPGHLGVLASIGIYEVSVTRRPRVAVCSTGDELVDGPGPLARGQIRDANRYSLIALLERDGFDVVDLGLVADDEAAIEAALLRGVDEADAVVTSGGVSMGDFDYVKAVLGRIGDMAWMQVAIKPAKPLAFGTVGGRPVFGLPGNPVSSMVSYELFARPALRRMAGFGELHRPRLVGASTIDWRRRSDGKLHFARANAVLVDGSWELASAGGQGSHQLSAMAGADALVLLDDGDGAREGDRLEFFFVN